MAVLHLWAAGVLALLRTPWLLGPVAALFAAVPLLNALRPPSQGGDPIELVRFWCFPGGLLGASMALTSLGARADFLQRLPLPERLLGEWGTCALATLILQLPIAIGALLAEPEAALDLLPALADILSSDLHLAGLAFLSLTLPMPANARPLSLLALAWLLPALLAALALPPEFLAVLQPEAALRDSAAVLPSLSFAAGLSLATALVRSAR